MNSAYTAAEQESLCEMRMENSAQRAGEEPVYLAKLPSTHHFIGASVTVAKDTTGFHSDCVHVNDFTSNANGKLF